MKRKEFIKLVSTGAIGISSLGYLSCENQKEIFFKLSLAQWSFNKSIREGGISPYLFAEKSKELDVFFSLPKEANQSPPLLKIVGTTAIVSTLLIIVGHP